MERTASDWLAGDGLAGDGKLVGERFIPLRYFNGQAAVDFSREWLGYSGNDLHTFRRSFTGVVAQE